jgi:hypothetical protein
MKSLVLAGLLLLAMAVPMLAAGGSPNVSEAEDLQKLLTEAHADLIQVRESADPRSPVLYEIHMVYIPRLSGEKNPEIYRSGPVLFIAVWSPEMGEQFGFFTFGGEQVVMGSAPGFSPSYATAVGPFSAVHSDGSVSVFVDEDTGEVGIFLPPETIQYGLERLDMMHSTNPVVFSGDEAAEGPVPFALGMGNLAAAQSEDASTVVAPVGGSTEGGDPGDPLRYALSELDLSQILEAAVPWVFSTPYGEEAIGVALDMVDKDIPIEGFASLSSKTSGSVTIYVPIPEDTTGTETFYAFGTAVPGIIPVTGQVTDGNLISAVPTNYGFDLVVIKHFCSMGSCTGGTFDVQLNVKLNTTTHFTTATWTVISGTGAYQNLSGSGALAGIPDGGVPVPTWVGITDIYYGTLSIP